MTTQSDDIEDSAAPLIEHLAELRTRLIRAVIAFFIAMCLCFFVAEPLLDILKKSFDRASNEYMDNWCGSLFEPPETRTNRQQVSEWGRAHFGFDKYDQKSEAIPLLTPHGELTCVWQRGIWLGRKDSRGSYLGYDVEFTNMMEARGFERIQFWPSLGKLA